MPSVIDSLVVLLNLDPKNFTEGQKEALDGLKKIDKAADDAAGKEKKREAAHRTDSEKAQRTAQREATDRSRREKDEAREKAKVEAQAAKQRAEAYNTVKESLLGFGAALAAVGVEKFIMGTAATVAATGRLAHNLDLPIKMVSAFGMAVSQSIGGSTEDAIASLQGLSDAVLKLNTGQDKSLLTTFNKLAYYDPKHEEFHTTTPDGKSLDPLAIMDQLAQRGGRTDPKYFSSALRDAGFSPDVISYLEKGPAFGKAAFDSAYSRAPTDADAAAEQKLIAATNLLEQRFNRIGQLLVLKIAPDLIRFMADANSLANFFARRIGWDEFMRERAQHKVDAEAAAAEAAAAEKGVDAPKGDAAKVAPQVSFPGGDGVQLPYGPKITSILPEWMRGGGDAADTPPDKRGFWTRFVQTLGFGRGVPKPGMLPKDIEAEVRADARKYGLDPEKMVALFRTEGGGFDRVSGAGAFGPAQLMPGTAAEMGVAAGPRALGYTWQGNTDAGERYFAKLLKLFRGNYQQAEAAYNAGPQKIRDVIAGRAILPEETRRYVSSIASVTAPGSAYANGAPSNAGGDVTHDNRSDTHIGEVNVYTDQKHAPGIAGAIRGELSKGLLVPKANTGLQ